MMFLMNELPQNVVSESNFKSNGSECPLSSMPTVPDMSEFEKYLAPDYGHEDIKEKLTETQKSAQAGTKVISSFLRSRSRLVISDAYRKSFSLENSLKELSKGLYFHFYSSFRPSQKEVFVVLKGEDLFIDGKTVPIRTLKGLLLGASSANFLRHKAQAEQLSGLTFIDHECFSLVSELKSFDFSTKSATARYYFLIAMSWLIHAKSSNSKVVPLSKANLTLHTVRSKIQAMAAEANVRPNELFVLAILKRLNKTNDTENEMKVRELFLKRFSLARRLFNVCSCQIKANLKEKVVAERQRLAFLNSQRINNLKLNRKQILMVQKPKEGLTRKQKQILSYLVPGVKSIFQSKRNEHSSVFDLRRELTNSSMPNID